MPVRTSANFYRRGVPNSYSNFAFVAQTNSNVSVPTSSYIKGFQLYNRNVVNTNVKNPWPWSH